MTKENAVKAIKDVLFNQKNVHSWSNDYDDVTVINAESGRVRVGIIADSSRLVIMSRIAIARKEIEVHHSTIALDDIERIYSVDCTPVLWVTGKNSVSVALTEIYND